MRGMGKAGLCTLALTALVAAGCGSDDDEKSTSSDKTKPARGFDGDGKDGGAAPKPPPGDVDEGKYWNGKDPAITDGGILLQTNAGSAGLYATSVYDGRDKAHCHLPVLVSSPRFAPNNRIDGGGASFSIGGNWSVRSAPQPGAPGEATGKLSDDGNTVTLSWKKYTSTYGQSCGTAAQDVVLTRK